MDVAIVAVGSELLGTVRSDTNSLRLTAVLRRHGVTLLGKSVIGDNVHAIAAELLHWLPRVDLVVVSGGLGPTSDDVTRQGAAAALDRSLRYDETIAADLRRRFARFGVPMPEVNLRQAEVIAGAEVLSNPGGTAPGQLVRVGDRRLVLLPGVPSEFDDMIRTHLEPLLEVAGGGAEIETRTLKAACLGESALEERLAPAYAEFGRESISVLSSPGEVSIQLTATGAAESRRSWLTKAAQRITELVGEAIFSQRGDLSLEEVVGRALREAGRTVSTAESCTGGLVARRLTSVPGSSAYFAGGCVAYSNRVKEARLGVPADLLAAHGAVSEAVAEAMAEGARTAFATDLAVAITGVAGPDGGRADKPVGRVHLALCDGQGLVSRRLTLPGDRAQVRRGASQWALEMIRRRLPRQATDVA